MFTFKRLNNQRNLKKEKQWLGNDRFCDGLQRLKVVNLYLNQ